MSDNKILSQEEINALLSGTFGEEPKKQTNINDYLTIMEQDALGEIGNISLGNSATSLSILLGQEVDITTPSVEALEFKELKDKFPNPHVSISVDYTEGIEGMNLLVLKEDDAKIIADLMMGGNGTSISGELNDLHVSAVQEAMNQMMGSAATSMSTLFNRRIDISPPGIQMMNANAGNMPDISEQIIINVSFRLRIGSLIDSNIMQLIPLSFAKSMVDSLLGGVPVEHEEAALGQETVPEPPAMAAPQAIPTAPVSEPKVEQPVQPSATASVHPVTPYSFPAFSEQPPANINQLNLNLLMDIQLQVSVELGRATKKVKEILELTDGSVVELDTLSGEPVDILVNNKLVAKGEVVVVDESFAVRLTQILTPQERIKNLK